MNSNTEGLSSRVSKLFIICMIISPIVSLYSFHGLSLATVLIVLSYTLYLLNVERRMVIYNLFGAILMAYIVINTLFCVLSRSEGGELSIIFRAIQYFILLFIPLSLNYHNFEYNQAKKIYIKCAFFVSLFLIVQYLAVQIAGVYISGIIQNPLFPPSESILEITSNTIVTGRRVSGVFSEPAAHGVYAVGAFALALFDEELKHRVLIISVLCLSILMCVSSTGILTMLFVIGIYVICNMFANKRHIGKRILLIIPIIVLAIVLVQRTSYWSLFKLRMQTGNSGYNRIAAYSVIFSQNISELVCGHGMNLDALIGQVYYSGYPRYIFYFGLLGLLLWFGMILKLLRKVKKDAKVLIFTLLFLNIGESTMIGFAGGLFLFLICIGKIQNDVCEGKSLIT